MALGFLAPLISDDFHRGPMGRASVRDDNMRVAVQLHYLLKEIQCGILVASLRDKRFKHLSLMINRTAFLCFVSQVNSESVDPMSDRFVANINSALMEQAFNIAQGQRKPDIHHLRTPDDLGGRLEVAKWVPSHLPNLSSRMRCLKTA